MKKFIKIVTTLMIILGLTISVVSAASVEEKRQSIRNSANETLNKLYAIHPSARQSVDNAAGYAVFSITDVKIVFLGGGGGKGVAVNNSTKEETFMRTGDVQVGFGLGIKKFDVVLGFQTQEAFMDFINDRWVVGGQATVAATDSVNGGSLEGAVSAGKDTWMYQLTDKGLEASLTIRGIRYFRDKDLN
ncbi:MAG: hypothetical protein K0R78_689 [Pelosinus sp.]|jgi:lipid-binding SYLF domain-containing protein|nr:hypothetical protein [Pelosinus sp.]